MGNILEKEQLLVIRLVYPGNRTQSIEGIKHLMILLPSGQLKAISELAEIKLNAGDAQVERENLQSMGVITSRLQNRDMGSSIKEIQQKIGRLVKLPLGYHIEYGGEYAQQQQSFQKLLVILITSSLLVFGVILFLFKEFWVALIIII